MRRTDEVLISQAKLTGMQSNSEYSVAHEAIPGGYESTGRGCVVSLRRWGQSGKASSQKVSALKLKDHMV